MKRRDFITLLGGAVAAWPLAADAQKPGKLFRIGYLNAAIPGVLPVEQRAIAAFIMGLAERGLVQDRDFVIEYRYGDNRPDRLAEVAAELVDLKVDVLVTVGTLAPLALKRATSTIPIVLTSGGDPVGSGLVDSLARPGGNVTGLSLMVPDLGGKRLDPSIALEDYAASRSCPSPCHLSRRLSAKAKRTTSQAFRVRATISKRSTGLPQIKVVAGV
jgi:putative tryptophan/tyrosine transport system substrate-binding protein